MTLSADSLRTSQPFADAAGPRHESMVAKFSRQLGLVGVLA